MLTSFVEGGAKIGEGTIFYNPMNTVVDETSLPFIEIGKNCRIHVCVNIGTAKGCVGSAPKIGSNVYIGPGAKIFGPIVIADDCVIGANAVVNRDCCIPGTKLLGIPAKEYR